jgi:branched-chain amino acid transport system substrate-binding protein
MQPKFAWLAAALAAAFGALAAPALAQTQGVTDKEILVGTIQDLSGPIAAFGKSARNGMQLRADEINEQGGINGRKIRLIVEDSGYDPKKGVLAAQKLAQKDKVFVTAGSIGTPIAMATMDIFFQKNIPHLFPLTAARQMYEPLHKLKYSFAATYYDQVRAGIKYLAKQKADRKWCTIYQDDDFGTEILAGAEAGLKDIGKTLVEKTSYKRGATDFSSQVAKMKGAGCDTVVMGTIIRETVGTIAEARKTGFNAEFLGTSAAYTHLIPKLGGPAMNGFIAAHTVAHPYLDDAAQNVRFWASKYKTKFGEDPDVFSAYGYSIMDEVAATAAKAGKNLTTEAFIKALDSSTFAPDMFGSDTMSFTPTKHLGSNKSRLSQIKDGKWTVMTGYVEP